MDDDLHFSRYRREHAQRLDAEYRAWLEQRRGAGRPDAANPSAAGHSSREQGPLESLGRAVSETVTGSLPPGGTARTKPR